MKRNGMKNKFIALCSAIMMLIQICSVQVFADSIDELVSSQPSDWTVIADSAITDGAAGGWKKSGTAATQTGSTYELNGSVEIETAKAANGYSETLVLTTKYQLGEGAYFTIEGKNLSGASNIIQDIAHDTTNAPIFINISRTAITQGNVTATSQPTINETITDTGVEHTLTAVFYIENNSVQIWRDNEYIGVFSFRVPYVDSIISLKLRGRTGQVTFKDANVYSVSSNPISVGDNIINEKFSTSSTPSGWTLSGSTSVETGSVQDDYLLKLQENNEADCQANFVLPEEITQGIFNVSYDFCVSSDTVVQFYLSGNQGHRVTANIKNGGMNLTVGGENIEEVLPTGTLNTGTWYTIKYIVDLTAKAYKAEVYKTEDMSFIGQSTNKPLRYSDRDASLTKGFFRVAKGNGDVEYLIDNFQFEKDITNYGYLQIIPKLNSGLIVNGAENSINGVSDLTVAELKSKLYCHSPNTIVVTDVLNNVLPDSSVIAGGYVMVKNTVDSRLYTIKTEVSMSLLGLEVSGKEWAETETVLIPGAATVRAIATNNAVSAKTFKVRAMVGEGTPVESGAIEIPAGSSEIIKLENLVIPDNTPNAILKFDLLENETVKYSFNKKISTGTEVSVPTVFADGMVLQRGEKTNIFGMAPTGSQIEVTFDGQTKTGVAANGEFCVQLENLTASNTGKTLTIKVVVYGETETFACNLSSASPKLLFQTNISKA